MRIHLATVPAVVACLAAGGSAFSAELQPPTLLDTPGLSIGPTPGSTDPVGAVTTCAPLPAPVGGITPGQLVVRNAYRPDVGPYTVELPGYGTGADPDSPQFYRPFLLLTQPGNSLRFDVVNQLDTGSLNENDTNLHTHGLIVQPRPCTPLGDYIFVSDAQNTTTSYRIDVPPTLPAGMFTSQPTPQTYPSGLYWMHGHLHEYTADEVTAGQSAILYIGDLLANMRDAPGLDAATSAALANTDTVFMGLRDIQLAVPAGITPDKAGPGQQAQWLSGNDYVSSACLAYANPPEQFPGEFAGPGYCGHHGASIGGQTNPQQDTVWLFTVNGQYNPTITMQPGRNQNWRLNNLSANLTYALELDDDATGQAQPMTALAFDGIVGGTNTPGNSDLHVGVPVKQILSTPGNRIELFVPNSGGQNGRKLTLRTVGITTGAAGDPWPRIDIAHVVMPPAPAGSANTGPLNVTFPMAAPNLTPVVGSATNGTVPENCSILPVGKAAHRLITFRDGPSPGEYVIGSQVVDAYDRVINSQETIPPEPFPMAAMTAPDTMPHVCPKLGEQEVWEIVNESGEMHNFHIHQNKFRLTRPGDAGAPAQLAAFQDPTGTFTSYIPEIQNASPSGVVDIWRDVIALPPYGGRVTVTIPFLAPQQVGNFVYHCHILTHEEGGMMAVVQVYDPG